MATKSQKFNFLIFLGSKLKSPKLRKIIICIIISYISLKLLKKLYKRRYDKVKYITLQEILSCSKKYDFIVVGAGTSGSCVAGLLARDKRRPNVLLIEAGSKDNYHPLSFQVIPILTRQGQKSSIDWQYFTTPQKNGCDGLKDKRSFWPRGKVCGGTSMLNYMVYVRGNPADYNEWSEKYECKGWSWKELVPIFGSLEKCLFKVKNKADAQVRGFNGLQKICRKSDEDQWKLSQIFVEAARKCGFKYNDDYNGVSQDGVSYTQYNIDENGRKLTSFRAFVASLFMDNVNKYNIDILANAHVTQILCKDTITNMKVAYGVELNNDEKQNIFINENNYGEVIVCGGAIGSPHLLMLSGIGDADELHKHDINVVVNIPGVGLNLRDHFMQAFRTTFRDEKTRNEPGIIYQATVLDQLKAFKDYLFYGKGPITTTGLDAHIFTKSKIAKKDGLKSNDLQLVQVMIGESGNVEQTRQASETYMNHDTQKEDWTKWALRNKSLSNDQLQKSVMSIAMLVRPKSVGSIRLASNNPYDHPLIDPNYLSHKDDFQAFMEGWQTLMNVYKAEPFRKVGVEVIGYDKFKDDIEMGKYKILNLGMTIYHPVGTCKMGNLKNDKFAVCSERLRVRGFSNLRVVDASIAPDIIAGNTQGMCYIIGCKGAKMILQDWQQ